jgi:hypothetical protein
VSGINITLQIISKIVTLDSMDVFGIHYRYEFIFLSYAPENPKNEFTDL